jgi:hypothetical protein
VRREGGKEGGRELQGSMDCNLGRAAGCNSHNHPSMQLFVRPAKGQMCGTGQQKPAVRLTLPQLAIVSRNPCKDVKCLTLDPFSPSFRHELMF